MKKDIHDNKKVYHYEQHIYVNGPLFIGNNNTINQITTNLEKAQIKLISSFEDIYDYLGRIKSISQLNKKRIEDDLNYINNNLLDDENLINACSDESTIETLCKKITAVKDKANKVIDKAEEAKEYAEKANDWWLKIKEFISCLYDKIKKGGFKKAAITGFKLLCSYFCIPTPMLSLT